jgi:rhodanese-related sulfurtransferase
MEKMTVKRFSVFLLLVLSGLLAVSAVTQVPGKEEPLLCGVDYIKSLPEDKNAITPEDLQDLLNTDETIYTLIDLRSADECSKGSLPGAYNVNYHILFTEDADVYFTNEEITYILIDNDGSMSFQLIPFFIERGLKVKALTGGIEAWARMVSGEVGVDTEGVFTAPTLTPTLPPPPPSGEGGDSTFKPGGCG